LLHAHATNLPDCATTAATGAVRRAHGFAALRKTFAALCGDAVGGTRLDNLVCDGFLPLLAARGGREREPLDGLGALSLSNGLHGLWYHWWPGDLPPRLARGLRELEVFSGRARPACHGAAQGLLGWWLERESRC
jgi:hypothetical protein